MRASRKSVILRALLVNLVPCLIFVGACESTHEVHTGDDADVAEDADGVDDRDGDAVDDAGDGELTVASCEAEDGVTVEGVIEFDGEVPAEAQLWLSWMTGLDVMEIPPCSVEIVPAAFPAHFRIDDVPRGETWALRVLLDVDGSFPPMPAEGDFIAEHESGVLDLSDDIDELMIDLVPYEP